jgi:pimeloyl-ACP methyl ester carboxylesterase
MLVTEQTGAVPEALATTRIDVRSRDGLRLAVWVGGDGPPIVLVHGSIADHTTLDPFVAVLGERMTTYAMDRRGFGGSEDGPEYSIERDFDDVAAVVDAVAARHGGPLTLFGHSYGANAAVGGAARSGHVDHLVLYEPSFGLQYPPNSIPSMEAALAAGDPDAAIVIVLTDILGMGEDEIDEFRANPLWPTRLAVAGTIPRECRVEEGWGLRPGQFDTVSVPTLMLTGSDSPPAIIEVTERLADLLPNARIVVLDGHGHFAHKTDPAMVTDLITGFAG